jgi:hypothetical protein
VIFCDAEAIYSDEAAIASPALAWMLTGGLPSLAMTSWFILEPRFRVDCAVGLLARDPLLLSRHCGKSFVAFLSNIPSVAVWFPLALFSVVVWLACVPD